MADMIITSECEQCIHSTINEENKARIKIYCSMKDKTYYWGQCIPCDYKEVKKIFKKEMKLRQGKINS